MRTSFSLRILSHEPTLSTGSKPSANRLSLCAASRAGLSSWPARHGLFGLRGNATAILARLSPRPCDPCFPAPPNDRQQLSPCESGRHRRAAEEPNHREWSGLLRWQIGQCLGWARCFVLIPAPMQLSVNRPLAAIAAAMLNAQAVQLFFVEPLTLLLKKVAD